MKKIVTFDFVFKAPCPDSYRGKYRDTDHETVELGRKYAEDVKQIISSARDNGRNVAAFISESLQSCGGQVILPPGYLRNVYRYV